MKYKRLLYRLERVARRYRLFRAWLAISISWFAAAMAGIGLIAIGWTPTWTVAALAAIAFCAACIGAWYAMGSARDYRWIARQIEARNPDLDSLLLAAVEQEPDLPNGRFGYLQEAVISEAIAHCDMSDWDDAVPQKRLRSVERAGLAGLVLLIMVLVWLGRAGGTTTSDTDFAAAPSVLAEEYEVTVEPGDTEIERGSSLIVTARFEGGVPDQAALVCEDDAGTGTRIPMSLSLSDPMFGCRMPGVRNSFRYRVAYAGTATPAYRVTVYEHPKLQRADADLVFPAYTGLEARRVEDTRRITAVEGTEMTLLCRLNKPVERAELVSDEGEVIELSEHGGAEFLRSVTRTLTESGRYRLKLQDTEGRTNKEPPEFVFTVTPNRRPDVEITRPKRDVRVSPVEELETAISVRDDFGLSAYGISYAMAGDALKDVTLSKAVAGGERTEARHLVNFEALSAEPDELLSYTFWAEDVGPDGTPRRTFGDMYFAEVRHFEEIFRQGQQPPRGAEEQQRQEREQGQGEGQQGGAAQQAEQLVEKQKQIINATWKVIRRETGAAVTEQFLPDTQEILTGQQEAIDQVGALGERITDAASGRHLAAVLEHMTKAIEHLTEAVDGSSCEALSSALSPERAAYQALLKLRARQYDVIRANRNRSQGQRQERSGSATGRQSRFQGQIDQLQLRNTENRYELERQAQGRSENQAQRETRQVLNRLRDLARRQSDVNERLKELQSALREAETEEERKEILEQLKRLRDHEEEILRDTDELGERMDRQENQERMADSRRDLRETRERIRQTTEALREGQVPQAITSGTRAERELTEMREEFQRRASNRFSEAARQLREDARQLDARERELGERLRDFDGRESGRRNLRDPSERKQLRQDFQDQRGNLNRLLEEMKDTIEKAEETEPLMTRELYDALRTARQQKLEEALDITRTLLDRGFLEQARTAEANAGQGIEELREGVERAAESVLGDQEQALRRARDVLDDLANELNEEIARADPEAAQRESRGERQVDRQGGEQSDERRPERSRRQDSGESGERPPERQSDDQRQQQRGGAPREGQPPEDQQGQRRQQQGGGAPREGQPSSEDQQGQRQQQQQRGGAPRPQQDRQGDRTGSSGPGGNLDRLLDAARPRRGPIMGDDFLRWSDDLRSVEEMLEDRELRAEAARIRERARGIRMDLRRDFKAPEWDIVREAVAEPLDMLRARVAEELLKRSSEEALVPIDRDPVPARYADEVRRYYEELGTGK